MTRVTARSTLFASFALCFAQGCATEDDNLATTQAAPDAGTEAAAPLPDAGPTITPPSTDASDVQAPQCGSVLLEAKPVPANVVVVFDQSNSMKQPFSGGTEPKWTVAKDAVEAALTPIAGSLNLGAVFYPTQAPNKPYPMGEYPCPPYLVVPITQAPQIAIEPGVDFLEDWQAHFAPPWTTVSSTPMTLGLKHAAGAFLDPSAPTGARAVVLVGDGAPTCEATEDQVTAPVLQLKAAGVSTYVIALTSGPTALSLLHAAAIAGGTDYARTAANGGEITKELEKIVGSTIDKCNFTFDPPPPKADDVHLVVTDEAGGDAYEVPLGSGWTLSPDGTSAELTDAVCQNAKDGVYEKLEFVFGCPDPYLK